MMRPITRLPNLRHLRYLCALEEHLHFGRAAEACAVTQSTLSTGIQEVEALLGAVLVERTKRKVLFTPLGRTVAARARRILREAEDLAHLARGGGAPLAGTFRLGVIPTIAPYLLPDALPALRAAYPDLRLYLREDRTALLLDRLESGQLDAVVMALPYDIGTLATMSLAHDALMLVCRADHPLADRADIDAAALAATPLLLLEDGHCLREHALRACALADPARLEEFQGTSLRTLVPMVASGLGVTLAPAIALRSEVSGNPDLVARPLRAPGGAREIVLVWRASSPRADEFRLLGASLQATLAAMREADSHISAVRPAADPLGAPLP